MLLWLLGDSRLIGLWRSDYDRTVAEIADRTDMTEDRKRKFSGIFGKLELRYTRWRCHSSFEGRIGSTWYRVLARDEDSAVVVSSWELRLPDGDNLGRIRSIHHLHFEEDWYWLTLGSTNIREFFRRIA